MRRAQSSVVGVALLAGVAVVGIALLTASVGTVIDGHVARADAARTAADLAALDPARSVGVGERRIEFSEGRLHRVERDVRVLLDGRTVADRQVGALVYEGTRGRGAALVAGAVLRRSGGGHLVEAPPVRAPPGGETVVVGAVVVVGDPALAGDDVEATLRTRVSHERERLGTGRVAVAVETATPAPLAAYFESINATVSRRDFDGDGVPSVVARFPGRRTAHLVVHRLEVAVRG